jgi:uncharacterized membrane protein YfbV (UPF0208 family)
MSNSTTPAFCHKNVTEFDCKKCLGYVYAENRTFLITNASFGVAGYTVLIVLCLYISLSQVRKLKAQGFLLQACLLLIASFAVNITVQGLYLWIYSQFNEDADSTMS